MTLFEKNMLFLKERGIEFKGTGLYGMPFEHDGETLNIGISEWGFAHIYKKPIEIDSPRKAVNLHEQELKQADLEFGNQ